MVDPVSAPGIHDKRQIEGQQSTVRGEEAEALLCGLGEERTVERIMTFQLFELRDACGMVLREWERREALLVEPFAEPLRQRQVAKHRFDLQLQHRDGRDMNSPGSSYGLSSAAPKLVIVGHDPKEYVGVEQDHDRSSNIAATSLSDSTKE